ncbi:hypothetical protein FS837_006461, partial [Tulasnella sp. UAMH 9824]
AYDMDFPPFPSVPPEDWAADASPSPSPVIPPQPTASDGTWYSAPTVSPLFEDLVAELESLKLGGYPKPLWGMVSEGLIRRDPNILARAGVARFKQYMELAETSGVVQLTLVPPGRETVLEDKGGTVDKMRRTVDMLGFAMDQPPSVPGAVIFISSDAEFVCALSALRNRGHAVGLLCPPGSADPALEGQASRVFRWNEVFGLPGDASLHNESLINFEVDATEPPANQPDWAQPPPTPPRMSLSNTFADLLTVQPAILNDDPPRQDSGPNSPVLARGEAASSQSSGTPPAASGQPLDNISIYIDLIAALEKETHLTGKQEHIHSKISERIRERNPDFLTNSRKGKFKKYLEAASNAGIVSNKYMNGEGWVTLNDKSMWRVAAV